MMPNTSWSQAAGIPHAYASYSPAPNAAPAYTSVSVRQSFGPVASAQHSYSPSQGTSYPSHPGATSTTTETAAQPTEQSKKIDWPLSVRQYVARSFLPDNMDHTVDRTEMEAKLKETISNAHQTGVMYTTDWDKYPLPQELIKQERLASLMSTTVALPNTTWNVATPTQKKRKSSDMSSEGLPGATAPWQSAKTNPLESRVSYQTTDKRPAPGASSNKAAMSKFQKQLEKRQRRFDGGYKSTYRSPSPPPSDGPIVGTCQTLEKRYLRLTGPPVISQVRPEPILHQTLDLLKKKWRKESNYSYICDQFKSLRQDLTVQHIKNEFTVSVYEIHARIALEKGDLGEYNQCQTQLRALYQLGLKGNPLEFKAYRILYFIHTANRSALNDAMADLTPAEKEERPLKHALNVRSALALGNYHRFFQLYLDTPNMGAYLMDMFVGRERLAALCNICRAYKPDVNLRFVTEELGFESDAEAVQFIIDHNGQDLLEERPDYIAFATGKAGQRFEALRAEAFRRVDIKGQI
ncbi:hypothetical protein MCOR02_002546 [Pyricularia oryzae]|nr:hypothetical protein MCOR02_002546 [Pyricularia oryzae]KAI6468574.1 hypothetical protein MCOR17_004057 [Pyricularia oryzae]KAI6508660.1 hypothetical protein MCOR13_002042 [Pyricularia oryzae]